MRGCGAVPEHSALRLRGSAGPSSAHGRAQPQRGRRPRRRRLLVLHPARAMEPRRARSGRQTAVGHLSAAPACWRHLALIRVATIRTDTPHARNSRESRAGRLRRRPRTMRPRPAGARRRAGPAASRRGIRPWRARRAPAAAAPLDSRAARRRAALSSLRRDASCEHLAASRRPAPRLSVMAHQL